MVRQVLGMAPPAIPIDQMGEQGGDTATGRGHLRDLLSGIAPTGDMVVGAGKFKTQ